MDKGGHYDVEMKGCLQKWAISCADQKGTWIRQGLMTCKCKGWMQKGAL